MNTTATSHEASSTGRDMVFTMGLPASGKSTKATELFGATHRMIDPDAMKENHPDYDPKNPQDLHEWSQQEVERMFAEALSDGGYWLVDGTGTNAEKMVRRMEQARNAGFTVRLVFVTCTLATSLRRNAARPRVVPEAVIRSKALDINTSFRLVAPHADTVEVIDNDKD